MFKFEKLGRELKFIKIEPNRNSITMEIKNFMGQVQQQIITPENSELEKRSEGNM